MLITSSDNNKIKNVRKLLNKKYSFENGLFVVEGEHLVVEALKKNIVKDIFVLEGKKLNINHEYDFVTDRVMKSISDLKSIPRVIATVKMSNNNLIGEKIVIIDDIQDPGNAGTIIRSCSAFGIDTIIFSKTSVSPYNSKVIRSTQGMIFNINIIVDDLEHIIKDIKSRGITLIGTSLKSSLSLKSISKTYKYAIIFGNEGNGINEKYLSLCDKTVKINMDSKCESLNVGVSCGIVLHHLYEANNE